MYKPVKPVIPMLLPKPVTDPGVPVNLYRTIPVNPICAEYSIYGYRVPELACVYTCIILSSKR